MPQFSFRLLDGRDGKAASATLTLADEVEARAAAAVHLSASPYFRSVEILCGEDVVCAVHRMDLDSLGRPFRPRPAPARAA